MLKSFTLAIVAAAIVGIIAAQANAAADDTAKCYAKCNKLITARITGFNKCVTKEPTPATECFLAVGGKTATAWSTKANCHGSPCADALPGLIATVCESHFNATFTAASARAYGADEPTSSAIIQQSNEAITTYCGM